MGEYKIKEVNTQIKEEFVSNEYIFESLKWSFKFIDRNIQLLNECIKKEENMYKEILNAIKLGYNIVFDKGLKLYYKNIEFTEDFENTVEYVRCDLFYEHLQFSNSIKLNTGNKYTNFKAYVDFKDHIKEYENFGVKFKVTFTKSEGNDD